MRQNHRNGQGWPSEADSKGFALVVTLLLMMLLSLLALGMLSLSSISLRSNGQGTAMAEAQANARMALMLAIGELQRQTGQDTRVTAQADVVEPGAPPLTGVWKSWEGTDHDGTGRPIRPDYGSKTQSAQSGGGRFLTWLVSGAKQGSAPQAPSELVSTSAVSGTVPLLAEGSLGDNPGQVHVKPQLVKNDRGGIAWWVSPENQKARLLQPHRPRTDAVAGWVEAGQSHSIPDAAVFGMDILASDPEKYLPDPANSKLASRGITLNTTEFLVKNNSKNPQHSFHDLSTSSVGLLTNTATGGWRKDLSLLTEKWAGIYASYPGGKLPLFRISPAAGATTLVPKPVKPAASVPVSNTSALAAATPPQSSLYPWSEYSTVIGTPAPNTYHAASASWESLVSFATSYQNFSYNAGGVQSPFVWDKVLTQAANLGVEKIYNYKHRQLLYPQIARFQFIVYATAVEDPARLNQNPKRYQLRLMYVPLFTLWNPYNVSLQHTISGTLNASQGSGQEKNFLGFGWRRSPPGVMAIVNKTTYPDPDLVPKNQYKLFTPGNFQVLDKTGNNVNPYDSFLPDNVAKYGANNKWVDKRTYGCWLPEGNLTFKPGEAKIFSPAFSDPAYGLSGVLRLREGYNPANIVGSDFNSTSNLLATQSFWFLMKTDRVTQPFIQRQPGSGFSLSFGDGNSHFGANSTMPTGPGDDFHNVTCLATESVGNKYWPPDEVDEVGYSIGELASGPWVPIFSTSFGPRMTIGTGSGTKQNRPTKGVVQNNALAGMVLSDPGSGDSKDHPANNTFDFAFHSLSIGSNVTPNLSDSNGFIATGYQSGDGLSRLIAADIPLRPMASLVELQGWNPRGMNPYPPFQMNLIGNSDATPLIPSDNIVPPVLKPGGANLNLMHDDAYCANHLLFDDWFVSSVAPQPVVLGGNIAKGIDTVYREYLKGEFKLSNRAYLPIADDSSVSDSVASARVAQVLNSPDGWLKMASRFEVEGMFNVNSTSVEAWKALLGHARNREKIAMYGKDAIQSVSAGKDHAVTRGAVATDVEAGGGAAIGGGPLNAAEYSGFRSMSDSQIEDLAEKVVEQVRLRGPFLSLSEFVNRQLSSKEDMALAGALQTAINNLDNDPMKALRNPANLLSAKTMPANDPKLAGVNYEFGKAADGDSAYGAPGWIRQADILRPIAPILSARDDTFTIRAYGDARDGDGNIVATAWCEATVQRTRDFVDSQDAPDSIDTPSREINRLLGRKYVVRTFRWLSFDEV